MKREVINEKIEKREERRDKKKMRSKREERRELREGRRDKCQKRKESKRREKKTRKNREDKDSRGEIAGAGGVCYSTSPPSGNQVDGLPLVCHNTRAVVYEIKMGVPKNGGTLPENDRGTEVLHGDIEKKSQKTLWHI